MLLTKLQNLSAIVLATMLLGSAGLLLSSTVLRANPKNDPLVAAAQAGVAKETLVRQAAADKAADDKEALQGAWIIKSGEGHGEKFNEAQLKNWEKLIFDGDKLIRDGGEKRELTYKIDPAKNPKEIDIEHSGQTYSGVYELKGNTLKLAITTNGAGRPTEFDSQNGILLVLEKEKK